MGVGTLFRYLIGDRDAIRTIAAGRGGLWVGLLFVLSAGFAREYDGEDLVAEPWYVLIPLAASLVASFGLFLVLWVRSKDPDSVPPSFWASYRSFLTLFWMTAPLAWLYAIPYERFLSPVDAVRANLWTLGLVAAWRVALMIRVVTVLTDFRLLQATCLVGAFADAALLLAVWLMPKPLFNIMGGIHLSESEQIIMGLTMMVSCFGIPAGVALGVGTLVVVSSGATAWSPPLDIPERPTRGLRALAVASLAVWLPILPVTQAEQRLRTAVEQDLRAGRITEGLAVMSAHQQDDFPPHWDPPPRIGYRETVPPLLDVLEQVADDPPTDWVRRLYLEKLGRFLQDRYALWAATPEMAGRTVQLLRRMPEGPTLIAKHRDRLDWVANANSRLASEDAANLKALLAESGAKTR